MNTTEFLPDDQSGGVSGVAVAIVTNNKDPKGMGRVKLTYPWRDAEDESFWARIAMPMAGTNRGTYFLPEVDDEVLVAFEDDDIHHPFVLGALWNGDDMPPEDNADGKNDVRKIRSRSGHEIVMDDADAGGKVAITTNAGHEIVLDDTRGSEQITVTDQSGTSSITLDGTGAIDLSSSTSISIDTTSLELTGQTVSIESTGPLTISGMPVNIN